MLSHNDNDHFGGARAISKQVPVKRFLANALQQEFNASQCRVGNKWNWDGVSFEILWPKLNEDLSENSASCVLKIDTGHGVLLLTGDIEAEAEQRLVDIYGEELASDILLLPHHGSNTSSTPAFLDAVQPRIAINSSGYRNRFQHPHQKVIKRLDKREIQLLDTQSSGAITIDMDPRGIETQAYREQRPRYYF